MRKTFIILSTLLFLACLSSCQSSRPIAKQIPQNNETYTISYLFEHDGCKVYRFYDKDNYVYFTNCGNSVTSINVDSTKTRVQTIEGNIKVDKQQ